MTAKELQLIHTVSLEVGGYDYGIAYVTVCNGIVSFDSVYKLPDYLGINRGFHFETFVEAITGIENGFECALVDYVRFIDEEVSQWRYEHRSPIRIEWTKKKVAQHLESMDEDLPF